MNNYKEIKKEVLKYIDKLESKMFIFPVEESDKIKNLINKLWN